MGEARKLAIARTNRTKFHETLYLKRICRNLVLRAGAVLGRAAARALCGGNAGGGVRACGRSTCCSVNCCLPPRRAARGGEWRRRWPRAAAVERGSGRRTPPESLRPRLPAVLPLYPFAATQVGIFTSLQLS